MKKYNFEIVERVVTNKEVEAESLEDAINIVIDNYVNGEYDKDTKESISGEITDNDYNVIYEWSL